MGKKTAKAESKTWTLCDSCIHAYGDDCFAVPFEKRDWVREYWKKQVKNKGPEYETRFIHGCIRYQRGRKPLGRREIC